MSDELKPYHRPVLPHERQASPAFRAGGLATAGIEFAVTVGLFFLAGRWLDGWLDVEPWLTIVLTMLGVGAAMALLIRHAKALSAPPGGAPPEAQGRKTKSGRADGEDA